MKNNKGFNLLSVIIIICLTSITSAITAGIIVTNNYGLSYSDLAQDKELNEFLRAYSNIIDNYYDDVDKKGMLDSALDAMLDYLDDNYTTYLNESQTKDLESRLSGKYKGIGISFKDGTVETVTSGGPAEKAGVLPGDKFLKIDNVDVSTYSDEAIKLMIRDSDKSKVTLEILRNEETLKFEIKLATLEDASISYRMIDNTNIGYLAIDIFSRTLTNQVDKALKDMESKGMEKLILDLRNNSGGYLDIAESTASLFLEKGKLIYSLEDKEGKEDYYDETSEMRNYPIVVILNGYSASAAEILAATLKDNSGAIFVGETSYGKGVVQQTYELDDGSMAKYTSAKWLRPNGTCINGVGLKPDYEVFLQYEKDENGKDVLVEDSQYLKAIEVISAK